MENGEWTRGEGRVVERWGGRGLLRERDVVAGEGNECGMHDNVDAGRFCFVSFQISWCTRTLCSFVKLCTLVDAVRCTAE